MKKVLQYRGQISSSFRGPDRGSIVISVYSQLNMIWTVIRNTSMRQF